MSIVNVPDTLQLADAGFQMGHTLDEFTVKKGLTELCPDLSFDAGGRLDLWHPRKDHRQSVYYNERHICSMDRGIIPEVKLWDAHIATVPAEWSEADREDVSIQYVTVPPEDGRYGELREKALKGSDPALRLTTDGTLIECRPMKRMVIARRVTRVGWRHTFERLLQANLPGITRQSLAAKFGVDMNKFPTGTPDEVIAALVEE